jgi:crossover junction endodeoxyribonuclease RuvC
MGRVSEQAFAWATPEDAVEVSVRVVGIDPGVAVTGYGVIDSVRGRLSAVAIGVLRTESALPQSTRLAQLQSEVGALFEEFSPDHAAVERLFFNTNVKTAMGVGQASGVVLSAASSAGMPVFDLTPPQVKLAVAGTGTASKQQVQTMVAKILGLAAVPSPPDAADACALALAHLQRNGVARAVAAAGDRA